MNDILKYILALFVGVAVAIAPATPTDLDYVVGPLEIADGTEDDEEYVDPYVYIEFAEPHKPIHIGDEITLRCIVVGLDNKPYTIDWEYSEDDQGYFDLDWHEPEYTFVVTYDNAGYYYRVVVRCEDE